MVSPGDRMMLGDSIFRTKSTVININADSVTKKGRCGGQEKSLIKPS